MYSQAQSQASLAWLLLSILFNVPWLAITGLIMVYIQMVMVIKTPYHCAAEHCYYRIWVDGLMAAGLYMLLFPVKKLVKVIIS